MFIEQFSKLKTVATLVVILMLGQFTYAGPREANNSSLYPAADVTDLYVFRSWQNPENVVFILNVIPGQNPGDGPGYFHFSDEILYRINIDNNMDGVANDIIYEIRFNSKDRPAFKELTFPLAYVGSPLIMSRPQLRGITALKGQGSEGITFRQTYRVFEFRNKINNKYSLKKLFAGKTMVAVPPNVGPITMPNYEMLAAQGIYKDSANNVQVFAGQRADSFYADTGALFDGAAPRRLPPVLTPQEDSDNSSNPFGVNNYEGRNVHSIVLEIPIDQLTNDQKNAGSTKIPYIGVFASATRFNSDQPPYKAGSKKSNARYMQISRMGNPMVKSLIIDTPNKDIYNESLPHFDRNFASLFSDPPLARAPTSEIFGIPVLVPPRVDLLNLYLKYPGQSLSSNSECGYPCAELLRLNVSVPPTEPEEQDRMGLLAGTDLAGFPNGRRPVDDVVDFTVRVIGGPALIGARLADGVNHANDLPGAGTEDGNGYGTITGNKLDVLANGIVKEFPYLATPHDGRGPNP